MVTEYIPFGNINTFCRPTNISSPKTPKDFFNIPKLQRAVGVSYHPNTEIQSHYGESRLALQYDTVVYIDQTNALKPLD